LPETRFEIRFQAATGMNPVLKLTVRRTRNSIRGLENFPFTTADNLESSSAMPGTNNLAMQQPQRTGRIR
jgi:hypothetical protein